MLSRAVNLFDVLGFRAGELLFLSGTIQFVHGSGFRAGGLKLFFQNWAYIVFMARSFVLVSCRFFLERCRAKSLERSTGQTGKLEQKRKDHVDFGACAFGCLEPKCVDPSLGVICLVCDVWVFIASVCLFSTEFSIQALYNL